MVEKFTFPLSRFTTSSRFFKSYYFDTNNSSVATITKKYTGVKKFFAEFIGKMLLVVFGCGSAVVSNCVPGLEGYLMIALAFGLVIVAMAYSVGNISGCHINPAVSMGMLVAGKMTVTEFFVYVIAQFCGATCGAAVLKTYSFSFYRI